MSRGTVYKKGEAWRVRFTTPGGDRVDRAAHTSDEQEAGQLLGTLTALAGLCHLYAVPFDPDDTLADVAAELVLARDEVEHVFGTIRCPHCARRIVPEWRPAALARAGQTKGRPKAPERSPEPPPVAPPVLPVSGEDLTERIVHDVVQGVVVGLEAEVRGMVAGAVGPRKAGCSVKGCKDFAFAKGLCHKHYYRDYHAKRRERERRRAERE